MDREETQLHQVKTILSDWAHNKGHDKCWHHPEILKRLCHIIGISTDIDPELPPREEFQQGCKSYEEQLYDA